MSTIRDIKSKLTQKALDALCTKYHILACVHPTLPGPDQNILQSLNGKVGRLKFLTLRSYVASKDFNLRSMASICSTLVPTIKGGCREKEPAKREVKLLTLIEGRIVSLNPPVSTASRDSGDSIDKLFDEGEVAVEKTKKKQKRKVVRDASGSTFPPKKLREDYHTAASNIGGKSLAAIRGLVPDGSSVLSGVTKPSAVVPTTPTPDDGPTDSVSGPNLRTCPLSLRDSTFAGEANVNVADDSHHSYSCTKAKYFVKSLAVDVPVMTVVVTTTVIAGAFAVSPPKVRIKSKNLEIFRDSTFAGEANVNVAGALKLNELADLSDSFCASQKLDFETMHRIYDPKWNVTNDSFLDDLYVCHDLTDRLDPPTLFSQLRAMDYDQLYTEFNVGATRQVYLVAERDAKIAHLKSLLSLKEAEALEAIRLRGQLSVVEATDVAKGNELRDLKERNFVLEGEKDALYEKVTTLESVAALKETELVSLTAQVTQLTFELSGFQLSCEELSSKVASLESKIDMLAEQRSSLEFAFKLFKGRMEAMQDEQATVLGNRVVELDAQLLEMGAHLDEEFYPSFLTTTSGRRWILTHGRKLVLLKCLQSSEYHQALGQAIGCAVNKGIQDGLKAGVDHGNARRDLSVIEAYDPSTKAKYIDVMNALGTDNFSLLSELRSKKDASMVDLMGSLHLEGPLAEIPRAKDLQPSSEQLMLPVHRPENNVVLVETSLSFSLQVIHSWVQRVTREIKEKRLSLTDVMVPLAEPLSSKSLIGKASTSATIAMTEPITTLSMTFASFDVVPPLLISNDQALDTKPHDEDPPVVTFEK
nr:hypothetical protein [Tanacetum cinerariifolium]